MTTSRPTTSELIDVARAQWALVAAQLLVWTRPRGTLVGAGTAASTVDEEQLTPEERDRLARRFAAAVDRAARRGLFRPLCLVRSIALRRLLAAEGVRGAEVRVGVRWDGRAFAAHAWVAFGDRPAAGRQGAPAEFVPVPAMRVEVGT